MTDSSEHWLSVTDYEGFYEVSNFGRVKSLDRLVPHGRNLTMLRPSRGRILTGSTNSDGYVTVHLSVQGHASKKGVHVLVCRAFHGGPPSAGHEVCHGDGNPSNNHAENLRWGTSRENTQDAIRHGTHASKRNALKTHCKHDHEFTPENTRIRANGARRCITCQSEAMLKWCRDNREEYNARMQRWREKNREAYNAEARARYRRGKESA